MELTTEATITEISEIEDKETNAKEYLIADGDEWKFISEEEYKKIIGDNDGE